jgi:lipopolysaccharide export system protein LptC
MAAAESVLTGANPTPRELSDLERRHAALARWRARSEQVRFFRKALPMAIAAILVFGIGWVSVRAIMAAFSDIDRDVGTIHLVDPVFYGRNQRGEPYVMTATEAVRSGADPNRIALTNPGLKQYTGNPQPQTVRALHGIYLDEQRLMDLSGHVVATDGKGYTFRSEFAHVDMPKNSVVGQVKCEADGPSGSITSDAYQIYDKGQHTIFTGHTHTHLLQGVNRNPNGPATAASATAQTKAPLTPAAVPPMQPSVITPVPR